LKDEEKLAAIIGQLQRLREQILHNKSPVMSPQQQPGPGVPLKVSKSVDLKKIII